MLREIRSVSQEPGGRRRRWFSDETFDLFVWYDADDVATGFQLCHDKAGEERAFTWEAGHGFAYDRVDAGESSPLEQMSPPLERDGELPVRRVTDDFGARSADIDPEVVALVLEKLAEVAG